MSFTFSAEPPDVSSWRPLQQHQSVTPESFVDGPPILHVHRSGCHVLIDVSSLNVYQDFRSWFEPEITGTNGTSHAEAANTPNRLSKQSVDMWVTTDALILFASNNSGNALKTVKISYPAISLHATKRLYVEQGPETATLQPRYDDQPSATTAGVVSALYFQLDPLASERDSSNPNVEDIEGTIDLVIVPPPHHRVTTDGTNGNTETASSPSSSESPINHESTNEVFSALNACADLWPDAGDEDEMDGAEEPGIPVLGGMDGSGLPGEGGWITSENMHQFQDVFANVEEEVGEDGVVRILGPGAGTRRTRGDGPNDSGGVDEADAEAQGLNGDDDGTKWQRTS